MSYNQALAEVMLRYGSVAESTQYFGGFKKYGGSIYQHMGRNLKQYYSTTAATPKCGGWLKLTHVHEDYEYTFDGTFSEHDARRHFVKGKVTCRCKKINQLNIYYEGTFDSLLRQVLDVDVRSFTGFNFQEDKK